MSLKSTSAKSARFPKSARLRKSQDFRFANCRRFMTDRFRMYFTTEGKGRLGVSLSKKILKNATARNRVKRLIKENFRKLYEAFPGIDVHLVGQEDLRGEWQELKALDIEEDFQKLLKHLKRDKR